MRRLTVLLALTLVTLCFGLAATAGPPEPPKKEKGFDDPLFKTTGDGAGFDDPLLKPAKKKGEKKPKKKLQKGPEEGKPTGPGIPK